MIDGTSRMILIEQASKAGVETSNFRSWYQLAAYALRMGALYDGTTDELKKELASQNLDPFIAVADNLNCDNLIQTDDDRSDDDPGCDVCGSTEGDGCMFCRSCSGSYAPGSEECDFCSDSDECGKDYMGRLGAVQ